MTEHVLAAILFLFGSLTLAYATVGEPFGWGRTSKYGMFATVLFLALALRIVFAWQLPFTNDEGAYLYDARTVSQGHLPRGDVMTKTPTALGLFALGVTTTHGSLWAARLVNGLAGLLTAVALFQLGRRFLPVTTRHLPWILWLLAAGPVTLLTLGHTEAITVALSTTALAVWTGAWSPRFTKIARLAFLTGLMIAAAFLTRKTAVAVLPALLWLLFALPVTRPRKYVAAASLFAGMGLVIFPWLFLVHLWYGPSGAHEALGGGYAAIITDTANTTDQALLWGTSPLQTALILIRIAAPVAALIAFSIFFLPRVRTYTPAVRAFYIALWIWLISLALLYSLWPTFLPDYGAEFFPAIILLGSMAIVRLRAHFVGQWRLVLAGFFLAVNLLSLWSAYKRPWTGMFHRNAVEQAAALVRKQVPLTEPLFTAAVIVPYLSGHHIWAEVSHPLWYRYAFVDPATKAAFLPPLADMEQAVTEGRVRWALVEHLTDYAYLRHPSQLITLFGTTWQSIDVIRNETEYRSNPLTLWQYSEAEE